MNARPEAGYFFNKFGSRGMGMKDYYQILGVPRQANAREIKKAFRKLAIAYHPDRNRTREAEAFIKEIIEAYEVLDDPGKRVLYDNLINDQQTVTSEAPVRPHRDPRYRRQAPNRNHKSEQEEMLDLMRNYLHYALFVSWCTLLCSAFLVCDFLWTPRQQTEVIKSFSNPFFLRDAQRFTTDRGNEFKISRTYSDQFRSGESITVAYSPWLMVPLYFRNNRTQTITRIPATIYGNFVFAPVFLLATSITGVVYRRGIMFRFNLGIVNFLLLLLNVLFLFVHHLHLS